MTDAELLTRARGAADAAYAPYSEFRVGAAVLTADGEVFTGANVENAAYGSTICAEANAIGTAVSAGHTDLEALAVSCPDDDGHCYPCGNCRQLMKEFGVRRLIVTDGRGDVRVHALDEVLPHAFGPEDLA